MDIVCCFYDYIISALEVDWIVFIGHSTQVTLFHAFPLGLNFIVQVMVECVFIAIWSPLY